MRAFGDEEESSFFLKDSENDEDGRARRRGREQVRNVLITSVK